MLDLHLHKVLPPGSGKLIGKVLVAGKKTMAIDDHEQHCCNTARKADVTYFEHAERNMGRLLKQTVDHQIGRGPNQGKEAAETHGISKRNQKFGRGMLVLQCPFPDVRGEHRHQRSIVDEGGESHNRDHHPQKRPAKTVTVPNDTIEKYLHKTRCLRSVRYYE